MEGVKMKHTLKEALITEIIRSKNNPYGRDELLLLNEFHLQSILQDLILMGGNYVCENIEQWQSLCD